MTDSTSRDLPREIAPGVFWFGECSVVPLGDVILHFYNSAFLVAGDSACLLVETGPPSQLAGTEAQLEGVLDRGLPPLRYIFTTHPETNHAGGLGRLLAHFPEAEMVGDPTDLHHYLPDAVDRINDRPPGTPLDLGGREFSWLPALFRDHRNSRWGFDHGSRVLFTGDGFAYSHYHLAGQCGNDAEDVADLELDDMTAVFASAAFPWIRFVDMEPYIKAMDQLLEDLAVDVVAPTHGLPVTDIGRTVPKIWDGLRGGRSSEQKVGF